MENYSEFLEIVLRIIFKNHPITQVMRVILSSLIVGIINVTKTMRKMRGSGYNQKKHLNYCLRTPQQKKNLNLYS
jgi:hypothetical protein